MIHHGHRSTNAAAEQPFSGDLSQASPKDLLARSTQVGVADEIARRLATSFSDSIELFHGVFSSIEDRTDATKQQVAIGIFDNVVKTAPAEIRRDLLSAIREAAGESGSVFLNHSLERLFVIAGEESRLSAACARRTFARVESEDIPFPLNWTAAVTQGCQFLSMALSESRDDSAFQEIGDIVEDNLYQIVRLSVSGGPLDDWATAAQALVGGFAMSRPTRFFDVFARSREEAPSDTKDRILCLSRCLDNLSNFKSDPAQTASVEIADQLVTNLISEQPEVVRFAHSALFQQGTHGVKAVLRRLESEESPVHQRKLAEALGQGMAGASLQLVIDFCADQKADKIPVVLVAFTVLGIRTLRDIDTLTVSVRAEKQVHPAHAENTITARNFLLSDSVARLAEAATTRSEGEKVSSP
ncbi:MAG: hypothetical protein KDD60_10480, partial [Bdellovibrionales bacterium]|nr:hypothetical protein [Bdellovibrionales bacterium]